MKDYSAMSDFEINKGVASYLHPSSVLASPMDVGMIATGVAESSVVVVMRFCEGTWFNYCNKIEDAWPIITANKITISFDDYRGYAFSQFSVHHGGDANWDLIASDSRVLRAAMIVYLQMMEQKS